ncbi:hypothetical protein GCM10008965_55310 [Methylorubrum aminovorans]|nr:hypothetical protein GCM10025880_32940 [Methylorubrum aminovorans]
MTSEICTRSDEIASGVPNGVARDAIRGADARGSPTARVRPSRLFLTKLKVNELPPGDRAPSRTGAAIAPARPGAVGRRGTRRGGRHAGAPRTGRSGPSLPADTDPGTNHFSQRLRARQRSIP